ncbi:hypothetical protein [Salinivibrio costicola]|uniref:hypothetical protein n=1 Tax=Salinivibrio costicola TaxID=51367 RepID=UPI000395E280|nr:hypothetical protein [Salinivibrio costicola]
MDGNSYKIDKNLIKHVAIVAVIGVVWLGFNALIVTNWGHMLPPVFIFAGFTGIYLCVKRVLDKRYKLTKLADSEKQIDVTISLAEYKKLREMRNEEHDWEADNTDKTAVNFRKHGE